jgi:tripartite-type tricarboxylate transporter receptor subunit TctC
MRRIVVFVPMSTIHLIGAIILALALCAGGANAAEPANFYQGKTVRIIVGLAAGGGYDLYARTLARHLGKHIPGNPAVVVENMTGAGSIIAASHVPPAKPEA